MKGEVLDESESLILEFKNYRYPWDDIHHSTILRTITGFLNRNGGIILVGVEEDNDTKRPTVRGTNIYNQKTREDINMELVSLCKKIYPDVIGNPKLNVEFVPIRSDRTK